MSTDKAGSDLDVFKDLKPQTPDGTPITDSKKTLMGIALPDGVLPPVPGSSATEGSPSVAPPPPSKRSPESLPPSRSASSSPPPSREAGSSAQPQAPKSPAIATTAPAPSAGEGRPSRLGLDSWSTTQPSAPHAAPAPSKPPAAAPKSLTDDIGWDDDDDKTQIYDKDTQNAAQSLLQPVSSGYATLPGGRPPPPMSRPPGSMAPPAPQGALGYASANSPTAPATGTGHRLPQPPMANQPVAGISPKVVYPMGIVMAVLIALALYFVLPKKGNLTVTVAGGLGNKELSAVEVYLDNRLRCKSSPCEIPRIRPGTHYVEIRAPGYQSTAKRAVSIPEGETAVINERLMRSGTGIRVFGDRNQSSMVLRVDGNEFGPLPQVLREMDAGEHVVQVTNPDPKKRYAPFEQRVVVEPNLMTSIGPIRLKVLQGVATIRAGEGADGAEITLRVGDSHRSLPPLPVRLEVETKESHVLVARKKGYSDYREEIVFEDGQAKKTFEITMSPKGATQRRAAEGVRATPVPKAPTPPKPSLASAAPARLDITSTPPSNVLLDGKPLGSTPLRGITVSPGTHRVIFINGSERKPLRIEATSGRTQKVAVEF